MIAHFPGLVHRYRFFLIKSREVKLVLWAQTSHPLVKWFGHASAFHMRVKMVILMPFNTNLDFLGCGGLPFVDGLITSIATITFLVVFFTMVYCGETGPLWPWSYGSWIYNYLYATCAYHYWCCEFRISIMVRCTTLCDSLSATCDRSVVFSTNKTDRHDITEILLKVALNTVKLWRNRVLGKLIMSNYTFLVPYCSACYDFLVKTTFQSDWSVLRSVFINENTVIL